MAIFSYKAFNNKGKEKVGTIEANNKTSAMFILKENGFIPITIEKKGAFSKGLDITFGTLVKSKDLAIFCRQMVGILNAGVTVLSALELMQDQTENKYLKKAMSEVYESVESGESLAKSLANHPKIFPPILINMIEAGELSGSLDVSFNRMAVHFEKEEKLRRTVKKAITYPIIVLIVAALVITILITFVIPSFVEMFEGMGMELPLTTQLLIAFSDFIKTRWYIIIGLIIGLVVFIKSFSKTDKGKSIFGRIKLKMPLFGKLNTKVATSRFSRTLSTLLASGISIMDALAIVSKVIENTLLEKHLLDIKEQVSRGINVSEPMKKEGLFPPLLVHMVRIGEDTGSLEEVMNNVADIYDEEVETTVAQLTTILEPLIIVVLAVVIGAIVISVLQPMFSMYDGIGSM
ncbi:type IV pilus assembly protein PilC [Natranaerovirga hydrolytica]|uniref:Type IV pilus assembly protein PilC n=1 Tax=Natranaerovirga hydrolytica TaxID=680378 RepID=A0A4R1N5U8_9FIRM|nr:type II secretion system F family protein [Natranaerovirga hydrolytica]TCK98379.1 type IV pilus assembly protein PilC [Natranaerovirga hydrolytica]